jgi:hypothetical protein
MKVRRLNPPTIARATASPEAKTRASPERSLVAAITQAHVWRAKIEGGKVAHVADLATAHGVGLDEIERLLPLAYAPMRAHRRRTGSSSRDSLMTTSRRPSERAELAWRSKRNRVIRRAPRTTMTFKAPIYLPAAAIFDRQVEQGDARAWRG